MAGDALKRIEAALAELGLPDRYGIVGGIRRQVAELLVDRAQRMGPAAFAEAAQRLVDLILKEVQP
jgi:hypothetical protein